MTNRLALRLVACCLLPAACCLLVGCQQKMARQPRYEPFEASEFFADGASARPPVPGAIPRGHLRDDDHLSTGRRGPGADAPYEERFPFPVTAEVMERGRERYRIFCAVCHGQLGYGDGKLVERGFTKPPSFHEERLVQAPAGYFVTIIANGYGAMPDYAAQVSPHDRWAITAYIRALQEAQKGQPAPPPTVRGGGPR